MARLDIAQMVADYRGVLHWNSFSTYSNGVSLTRPALDLPLFIKDHPIPVRKPKVTEVVTVPTIDPFSGKDTHASYLFFGSPDILQVVLSGWIITPKADSTSWGATVDGSQSGTSLGLIEKSYGDIVAMYIEGEMNQTIGGAWQRKDPDYYITPHGQRYNNPKIATWDIQYTTNMRKQLFNMTLYLET